MKSIYPAVFLCLWMVVSPASQAAEKYVEGQVLVYLQPHYSISELEGSFAQYSMEGMRKLSPSMNIWQIRFNPAMDEYKVVRDLQDHPAVIAAQFNHEVSLRNTPNDPSFTAQWSMNNTGQGGGVNDADIDAIEAWDTATGGVTVLGDTIVVAVIDGGFDLQHEDMQFFRNNNEIPFNGIDDDNNGYVDDVNGWNAYDNNGFVSNFGSHGTHVAGTVGALGNNNIGVAGVNWGVEVMAISGSSGQEATVVAAYAYALEMRKLYNQTNGASGAFVVATNSSFGVDQANPANFPIWCAMYDSMGKYGIVSAGATMNQNLNVDLTGDVPTACASNFLISVTNTTRFDNKNNGAAYGATTIDIGAPGTDILSTTPGNNYGTSTGTSMASPHVAGAIGLLYSGACEGFVNFAQASPDSGALQMIEYLYAGVDPISDLTNITTTGGRLNVGNSMSLLQQFNCATCDYSLSYNKTDIQCHGDDNGVIDLMFSNANGNLSFVWSTGSTNEDLIGLSEGTYTVTVSDTSGCTRVQSITIKEPVAVEFESVVVTPVNNLATGSISVLGTGGASGLLYSIDGSSFQTIGLFDGLQAGTYTVTVKDSNNCSRDTVVSLFDVTGIEAAPFVTELQLYPVPATGTITMEFFAVEDGPHRLTITNVLGQSVQEETMNFRPYETNRQILFVSSLAPGTYFLSIQNESGEILAKTFLID